MKKFVSLVLVLALALSLATVAMAAVTLKQGGTAESKSVDLVKPAFYTLSATAGKVEDETIDWDTVVVMKGTHTPDLMSDNTKVYYPNQYKIGSNVYLEVDKDSATKLFVNNGQNVYLVEEATDFVKTDLVVVKQVAAASDPTCGDFVVDATASPLVGVKAYVDADGDGYGLTTPNAVAYFNGVFVLVNDTALPTVPHVFNDKDAVITYKDASSKHLNPVTIACDECEKVFKVVDTFDKDWDADDFYVFNDKVHASNAVTDTFYIVLDSAAAAGTTATTVDSSKTFDAGVAMYVGLSLMSVAGSAVVIGKKKEF